MKNGKVTTQEVVKTVNLISEFKKEGLELVKNKLKTQRANAWKECVRYGITVKSELPETYTSQGVTDAHAKTKFLARKDWDLDVDKTEKAIEKMREFKTLHRLESGELTVVVDLLEKLNK